MVGISYDPELADVDNNGYVSAAVSVSTTQVEAKAGATNLAGREGITITNKGPNRVYYGPSGVTSANGDYLEKNQFASLPLGEYVTVYLICATGQSATVIVQELA